mgnify:FL=1
MSYTKRQYIQKKESEGWKFIYLSSSINDKNGTIQCQYVVISPWNERECCSITGKKKNKGLISDLLFHELILCCNRLSQRKANL